MHCTTRHWLGSVGGRTGRVQIRNCKQFEVVNTFAAAIRCPLEIPYATIKWGRWHIESEIGSHSPYGNCCSMGQPLFFLFLFSLLLYTMRRTAAICNIFALFYVYVSHLYLLLLLLLLNDYLSLCLFFFRTLSHSLRRSTLSYHRLGTDALCDVTEGLVVQGDGCVDSCSSPLHAQRKIAFNFFSFVI